MPTVAAPILFIHGLYMNATSWDPWIEAAAARGIPATAVSWQFHQGIPADLRAHIDPGLGHLRFGEVIAFLKQHIDAMPERPVLVGHSIGGLAVQKLVDEGYARAAVAVSPAPPQGVLDASPAFVKANWPHVNPFAGARPIEMTRERFHYTFCNTMTRTASDQAFEKYVVPESRNVPRSILTRQAHIDFARDRVPMVFLAGDRDHLTPAGMIHRNARRYRQTIEARDFANRGHFICNEPGWEEVAAFSFDWIASNTPE